MRERRLELRELSGGSMHFEADQIGHRYRLREHSAYVLEVLQQRFRVDVAFAAKHFVAVDRELVKQIARFVARLRGEFRQDRLQVRHFVRRHPEVGVQTHESTKAVHAETLYTPSRHVDTGAPAFADALFESSNLRD